MIQITTDIATLTAVQREALCAYINTFGTSDVTEHDSERKRYDWRRPLEDTADDSNEGFASIVPFETADADEITAERAFNVHSAGNSITKIPDSPTTRHAIAEIPSTDRLDKNGLPWDERIHASSHAKTEKGEWRMKRNVNDDLVAQVHAELKALMAVPAPRIETTVTASGDINGKALVQAPPPPPSIVVGPPPPPAPAPPPPPAPSADGMTAYIKLITLATDAINTKRLTQEQLAAAIQAVGVPDLKLLGNRLDLVPTLLATVETLVR